MTTVRIAHAEPWPGNLGNGTFLIHGFLVVLADDEGHRALPVWLGGQASADSLGGLPELLDPPDGDIVTAGAPEELTTRLLRAVGADVTGVDIHVTAEDIDELSAESCTARIEVGGAAGTRHITARLGLGLTLAAAAGAPVRVADAVMGRLAVPVPGDDLLGPFLDRVPPAARRPAAYLPAGRPSAAFPASRPRYEPRNMAFADGLDRWDLDDSLFRDAGGSRRQDYSASTEGQSAILSSAVPQPRGSAALAQAIFADDYRGATVVFRGEIRTEDVTGRARLCLEILRQRQPGRVSRDSRDVTVAGSSDWTRHEVTALIPEDAGIIRFGITLTGPGRVALRDAELIRAARQ